MQQETPADPKTSTSRPTIAFTGLPPELLSEQVIPALALAGERKALSTLSLVSKHLLDIVKAEQGQTTGKTMLSVETASAVRKAPTENLLYFAGKMMPQEQYDKLSEQEALKQEAAFLASQNFLLQRVNALTDCSKDTDKNEQAIHREALFCSQDEEETEEFNIVFPLFTKKLQNFRTAIEKTKNLQALYSLMQNQSEALDAMEKYEHRLLQTAFNAIDGRSNISLEQILALGLDINCRDYHHAEHRTLLLHAVEQGKDNWIPELIKRGANVQQAAKEKTLLLQSVFADAAILAQESSGDPNAYAAKIQVLDLLILASANIYTVGLEYSLILFDVLSSADPNILQIALNLGADPEQTDSTGKTALALLTSTPEYIVPAYDPLREQLRRYCETREQLYAADPNAYPEILTDQPGLSRCLATYKKLDLAKSFALLNACPLEDLPIALTLFCQAHATTYQQQTWFRVLKYLSTISINDEDTDAISSYYVNQLLALMQNIALERPSSEISGQGLKDLESFLYYYALSPEKRTEASKPQKFDIGIRAKISSVQKPAFLRQDAVSTKHTPTHP